MTDKESDIIRHSLGLTSGYARRGRGGPKAYRNHYCTHDGDLDLEAMVAEGWMERGRKLNEGRDRYYHVTAAGAAAVGSELPKD